MKSLANLLSIIIPDHSKAIINALCVRGYTKKEICRTDLKSLVQQDGRLLLNVLLTEACNIHAITMMQKLGIINIIRPMLNANQPINTMPANIIWIGLPKKNGDDTFSALSLATDMPKQPINFWVLDQYARYYQFIFNAYPNVRIIPVLNYAKKLNFIFSDKKSIYDDFNFYLAHPEFFGTPARLYVTLVDYIKIIFQWHEGGFVLDTNVLIHPENNHGKPITHLSLPQSATHSIQVIEICPVGRPNRKQPDIWFMYSADQLRFPLPHLEEQQLPNSTTLAVECLEKYRQMIAKNITTIESQKSNRENLSDAAVNKRMSSQLCAPAVYQATRTSNYYCSVKAGERIGLIECTGFLGDKLIQMEHSAFVRAADNSPLTLVKYYQNSHLSLSQKNRDAFENNLRYYLSAFADIWIFQKYVIFSSVTHISSLTYQTMICSISMNKGGYPDGLTPEKWAAIHAENAARYDNFVKGCLNKNQCYDSRLIRNIPIVNCTIMHEVILYGNAEKLDQLIALLSTHRPGALEKMLTTEVVLIESGVQKLFTPAALAIYLNRTGCLDVFEKHEEWCQLRPPSL